ncbi:MAG TPA: DUF2844 domain-containing protein [Smithella sp.]|nr:DUF2844 domain-containing protein [Smithella sp.]
MKTRKLSSLLLCFSLALIVLFVGQAYATLGESTDSIATNRKALSAVRSTTITSSKYTVHVFQSETMTVREYVSPSGVVFGIAWNGLTHPDLTPLLGSYASEYQKAASHIKRQPGRKFVKVESDNVIVEKWGHMRNLQGRAYAPALMPQGVSNDEIK